MQTPPSLIPLELAREMAKLIPREFNRDHVMQWVRETSLTTSPVLVPNNIANSMTPHQAISYGIFLGMFHAKLIISKYSKEALEK